MRKDRKISSSLASHTPNLKLERCIVPLLTTLVDSDQVWGGGGGGGGGQLGYNCC